MNSSTNSTNLRSSDLAIIEVKPGVRFSKAVLADLLPDVETALFFGKVYELDYRQLSNLLATVLQSDLAVELFHGEHSEELQDYLVGGYYDEDGDWVDGIVPSAKRGDVELSPAVPHGEILPEVWKMLEVEVAQSIKDVATKLESVVGLLPGKKGSMLFGAMMKLNAKRPTLGDYRARIHHAPQKQNLLILDVSGSMTAETIRAVVDDVVALSYQANADMAVVSDTTTYWVAGSYSTVSVLDAAEYGGTHYETLADLFDRDWGTVITVADYDSSLSAKQHIAKCKGRIDEVIDISLVNRPTFLAECVGQLADAVRPMLIGSSEDVLGSPRRRYY